jgi:hypothetical protein
MPSVLLCWTSHMPWVEHLWIPHMGGVLNLEWKIWGQEGAVWFADHLPCLPDFTGVRARSWTTAPSPACRPSPWRISSSTHPPEESTLPKVPNTLTVMCCVLHSMCARNTYWQTQYIVRSWERCWWGKGNGGRGWSWAFVDEGCDFEKVVRSRWLIMPGMGIVGRCTKFSKGLVVWHCTKVVQ